jgi:hypothetical protein
MSQRKKLGDILPQSERDRIAKSWATTKPADDLGLLPEGDYHCRVIDGTVFTAKTGTSGYKLTFEIIDGDHAGRRIWHDVWLSDAAMSMAKRELRKLGITHDDQLYGTLPAGMVATVKLVLRRDDDGTERNRVRDFTVTGIQPDEPEPFAPAPSSVGPAPSDNGEAAEPDDGSTRDQQGFDGDPESKKTRRQRRGTGSIH